MTFCIITHVNHGYFNDSFYAYSPYVREMNIWSKHVDKLIIVAPLNLEGRTLIDEFYENPNIDFRKVIAFNFLTISTLLKTFVQLPKISFTIYQAMRDSTHIHLRCPGNMGLLGCIVQIFFPSKKKTAKYAGNWDLKAKQPVSYRIQKWILNNTFLTRNMTVLVYGEWERSSKNIKPFFTASYREVDKVEIANKHLNSRINFVFVGSLTAGKNPLYAVKLVEKLKEKNFNVSLSIYGNGLEFEKLHAYINKNRLSSYVTLLGNRDQEEIKHAYQNSHFVLLPSKSEGWPKVIAEGMFWKCLPVATKVSCVPNMLDNGQRGILLTMNLEVDCNEIKIILLNAELYQVKIQKGLNWSRKYTLDYFEEEIKKLVIS
ncbi:glycosyltransferase [Flavobacterium sp.]